MRKDIPCVIFIEQRKGILGGNLVRAEIFKSVAFGEDFFIDQIGFDLWSNVRSRIQSFWGSMMESVDTEVGQAIILNNV